MFGVGDEFGVARRFVGEDECGVVGAGVPFAGQTLCAEDARFAVWAGEGVDWAGHLFVAGDGRSAFW